MKSRMYTCVIASFFIGVILTLFEEAYITAHIDIVFGFTPRQYAYLLIYAILTAILLEVWCYLLPYVQRVDKLVYVCLLFMNALVWILPIYKSIFFGLYIAYITLLFAFQLFSYREANKTLKRMKELL